MSESPTFADVPSILYPALTYLGINVGQYSPADNLIDIVIRIDRDNKNWGFYKKAAIHSLLFASSSQNTIEYDLYHACYCLELDLAEEIKISWNPFVNTRRYKAKRDDIDRVTTTIEYLSNLVKRPPEVEFKSYDMQMRIETATHEELKSFCATMYDSMISQEHLYKQIIKNGWGM